MPESAHRALRNSKKAQDYATNRDRQSEGLCTLEPHRIHTT